MGKLNKVLIMAGGTGGHVFPGLAVATKLRAQDISVEWLGTQKGIESRVVPNAGIPIHYISISGLRGKGMLDWLFAPFRLLKAIMQSVKIIRHYQPDVIIGMGGFVSGPGGIASWLLKIPLVIHEQNARPGTTNKILARVAQKVLEGFPDTFPENLGAQLIGNPVRDEIINVESPEKRFRQKRQRLHLLVIGGSLGAQAINEIVPEALLKLSQDARPEVIHQTGEKHFLSTENHYKSLQISAEIKPFIEKMSEVYEWADIVLCRAGALTIAELCAVGLGALLIPYPYAIDDHQTANALFMVKNNAAQLLPQKDLTVDKLVSFLKELNDKRDKCFFMAQSAYKSRKIHAADNILKICEEICP